MNYFITGISGTGKSSVTQELNKRGLIAHDLDEAALNIMHWYNKNTGEIVQRGPNVDEQWQKDHVFKADISALSALLATPVSGDIFICGIVHNLLEVVPLVQKIFLLKLPPAIVEKRLSERPDGAFGKNPAERAVALGWQATFEKSILDLHAVPIDATLALPEMVSSIVRATKVQKLLAQPLIKGEGDIYGTVYPTLDFPQKNRSAIYGINLPNSLYFHPYNLDEGARVSFGIPTTNISLKFAPELFYDNLPRRVKRMITDGGRAPANVSISFVTQNVPWGGVQILARPHYLIDQKAPLEQLGYNIETYSWLNFLECENPIKLTAPGAPFQKWKDGYKTHVHTVGNDPGVRCSPNNMPVSGILREGGGAAAAQESHSAPVSNSFWSVTFFPPQGVGVTLHWILNDVEQGALNDLLNGPIHTIAELVDALEASSVFSGTQKLLKFEQLLGLRLGD